MGDFRFEVWPTEFRRINQYFGANPHRYAQFGLPGHEGIDIKAPTGSRVFCVAPGQVSRVRTDPRGHNYGIHVRVQHTEGFETIYAHLQRALVTPEQWVGAGTILGQADNTGNSFGSHLHLTLKKAGVRNGRWPVGILDPLPYLLPLLGWQEPAGPYVDGWMLNAALIRQGNLAQPAAGGATLRVSSDQTLLVPAGTMMLVREERQAMTLVRVPRVAVGLTDQPAPTTATQPPPLAATVDGWAWTEFLREGTGESTGGATGRPAVVGSFGINLRVRPLKASTKIGILLARSAIMLLGEPVAGYSPVRVLRADLMEAVAAQDPVGGAVTGNGQSYEGWALTEYLTQRSGTSALIGRYGVNLRTAPTSRGVNIGLVKAQASVTLIGQPSGAYTPIRVPLSDVLNAAETPPPITPPAALPAGGGQPISAGPGGRDSTPGWLLRTAVRDETAETTAVGNFGGYLRAHARRNATIKGYLTPATEVLVMGPLEGEYLPVRIDDALLHPASNASPLPESPDPPLLAPARIGLHASADPPIGSAEHAAFQALRPGLIKVLSFHQAPEISRLALAHPEAQWIVRAFLDFGDRKISPRQFYDDTIRDVRRTLSVLQGRDVLVELHNEPNVTAEGLGQSWLNGAEFSVWWRELVARYRATFPEMRFLFPGLSPGGHVTGIKIDHVTFLDASEAALAEADGLGVHLYWSDVYPQRKALDVLDDYIARVRSRRIWVTEASHNHGTIAVSDRAEQYLAFWQALQMRPTVQGVAFFVASASNPRFAAEQWVGTQLPALVGRR